MRIRVALAVLPLLALPLACAPADDDTAGDDPTPTESTSDPSGTTEASPSEAGGLSPECAADQLQTKDAGALTVATDSPAYEPWFSDDDPTNGKGYESAVAYAIADTLGMDVTWTVVPFNKSYAPGPKDFDFDINQISISPERAEAVDFSDGYYTATQAIIGLKDSEIATSTSIGDLASFKLGAQTGTTSLTAIRDGIKPNEEPSVFEDTNAAKQALLNGQVDGIVADLPTALYITAVEIPKASVLGQFVNVNSDAEEQFGMLFEKGNPLVSCINEALDVIKTDGTLAQLEEQWLSNKADIPVLQ
jgi:polar amino acid transport system substrate-binding protein